tara:strand:- start:1410 stop:1673 length:264 start_codon:yes stop_codon:yes gene_type:complete
MNELISNPSYMMIGVGAAISILGFFLKKQASQTVRIEEKVRELEVLLAKNSALDKERWKQMEKLVEDRRQDSINLYNKISRLSEKSN